MAAWIRATTVNIELFSVELEAFAHQAGASPTKQIVLVLDGADGAGWHDSPKVRAPEHIHLILGTVSATTSSGPHERLNGSSGVRMRD